MAGFERAFILGRSLGGYMGGDGLNPVDFIILEGDGNRPWFEIVYHNHRDVALGKIRSIVPEQHDPINLSSIVLSNIADASIIFCPSLFNHCPSMPNLKDILSSVSGTLDFNIQGEQSYLTDARKLINSIKSEGRQILNGLYVSNACFNPPEKIDKYYS